MSYRVLHLTSPNMEGEDVKRVQVQLDAAIEVPVGILVDGVYGPATGAAARSWKYRMGFPQDAINSGMGVTAQEIMFRGDAPLPPAYRLRRLKRLNLGWLPGWGIPRNNASIGERALEYGEDFVGLTEKPANSNVIPRLVTEAKKYGVPAGIANMGYPFCGFFYFLCSLSQGGKAAKAALTGGFNGLYTPTIMSVALAGQHNLLAVGRSQIRVGDGALFDFGGSNGNVVDHIGRVKEIKGDFVTLEGNTSFGPGGSQSNGGAIAVRTDRSIDSIKLFFREVA